MISAALSWIKSLFVAETVGILLKKLLKGAAKGLTKEIFSEENQRKAYEFVKELNANAEMSGAEKAKEFNRKMLEWAAKCGKVIAESAVNCLREMAVSVVKDEISEEKGE